MLCGRLLLFLGGFRVVAVPFCILLNGCCWWLLLFPEESGWLLLLPGERRQKRRLIQEGNKQKKERDRRCGFAQCSAVQLLSHTMTYPEHEIICFNPAVNFPSLALNYGLQL